MDFKINYSIRPLFKSKRISTTEIQEASVYNICHVGCEFVILNL